MATNTYASPGLPRQQQQSLRLLTDLFPMLLFNQFGERDQLKLRSGKKGIFRRYFELSEANIAQTGDGDVPAGQQITFEDITFSIIGVPSKVPLTLDQRLYSEDDLIAIAKEKIVRQLARFDDGYMFKQTRAGTQVRYAGAVADRAHVASAVTRADISNAVRDLETQNVPKVTKLIGPSVNISTESIPEAYIALCHPAIKGDVIRTDGFVPLHKYSAIKPIHPGEFGASPDGVRFIASTLISPWLNGATTATTTNFLVGGVAVSSAGYADVHPILMFGEAAFGHLELNNPASMTVNVIIPGSEKAKTQGDPMGENGCVAAKLYTGGGILDERRIIRLEVAASVTWA